MPQRVGVLRGRTEVFQAITRAVEPLAEALTDTEWEEGLAIVESVIAERPASMQRQLQLFLSVLEHGARLRYGKPLTRLDDGRRASWLRSFERSRVPVLRKGFWGVRTLALMAYYARPEGAAAVGYRASPAGWQARGRTA